MQPLLEVQNLTIQYRARSGEQFAAVRDVSFSIAQGETLGIMGESGSGKSSIALALLGLLSDERAQASGLVSFRGSNLLALNECALQKIRGAQISLIYQEPEIALSPVMRVGDQIAEVSRAHRPCSWRECRDHAHRMLSRVGFPEIERIYTAYPHQLSGGQRQRVVLAQALSCSPSLLIADEPTAHLDTRSQAEFLGLLESLKRDTELSILLISHTPEIQARLTDRLVVMRAGGIAEQGCFSELACNPRNSYARAILGSNVTSHAHNEFMEEGVLT